ncbi:MAG: hypothetical protein ACI9KE_002011, partial [Polyangiales bacterium]
MSRPDARPEASRFASADSATSAQNTFLLASETQILGSMLNA